MRPYYFDFDPQRTRRDLAIVTYGRTPYRRSPPPRPSRLVDILDKAAARLRLWRARSRGRTALARLDPRMLRDIGVTPSEASGECGKPFWRA